MFMAQLRGKLPSEAWLASEDMLTSAVLGTLKNLPPRITIELLARARPLQGHASPSLSAPLSWQFWPWWGTCEPDVVIEDERNLCVVETKLYSQFGQDIGAGHQLRREWAAGCERVADEGKQLWLVTLTNHTTMPEADIRQQLWRSQADSAHVCWLSWLEAGRLLRELDDEAVQGWRDDLLELL